MINTAYSDYLELVDRLENEYFFGRNQLTCDIDKEPKTGWVVDMRPVTHAPGKPDGYATAYKQWFNFYEAAEAYFLRKIITGMGQISKDHTIPRGTYWEKFYQYSAPEYMFICIRKSGEAVED